MGYIGTIGCIHRGLHRGSATKLCKSARGAPTSLILSGEVAARRPVPPSHTTTVPRQASKVSNLSQCHEGRESRCLSDSAPFPMRKPLLFLLGVGRE